MAFDRQIELVVGQGGVGTQISALDIDFDIERSITPSNNMGNFTVYNTKESTRTEVLKRGNNIQFKAGYRDEGNLGIVFFGTIVKASSRKSGNTWVTDIQAGDITSNKDGLIYDTISLSYKEGTLLSQIITDLATILSIPVAGAENAGIKLNNGFVYVGSINNAIRKINKTLIVEDAQLYFDSSEMVIFKKGNKNSKFGVTRITASSGLIGDVEKITNEDEEDTKSRIALTALLNPKLRPNGVINVVSATVNGAYIIEKCKFRGNNYGGDFFSDIEAVE